MSALLFRLGSIRPLVRYVDETQAVIDVHLTALPAVTPPGRPVPPDSVAELLVTVRGPDGSIEEERVSLQLEDLHGAVRVDLVSPQRWWPAGMGDQSLYELSVGLLHNDEVVERLSTHLGLTSVRTPTGETRATLLLVNGQECNIHSVVPVDLADERRMLPVAGGSLLVIRGHYGPEVLYQATDRAGILLVQCVPLHPKGSPEDEVEAEVARLVAHPSLAGWYVGHLGAMSTPMAELIRKMDPTRRVFTETLPSWAA